MSPRNTVRPILGGSPERALYGAIVSFENADEKTLTIHRQGPPEKVVLAACEIALRLDPSFRVVSYSTPQTIFADLDGARMHRVHLNFDTPSNRPEELILSRLGLSSMLHPRLRRVSKVISKQAELDPLEAVKAARERVR